MNISKSVAWTLFVIGLVGTWIGVYDMGVETVVFGLIISSISGLVLLHMRAEAMGRLEHNRGTYSRWA